MSSLSDSKEKLDDGVKRASESPIPWKIQQVLQQLEDRLSEKDVQIAELEIKIENLQVECTSGKSQLTRQHSKNCKENNFRPSTGKPDHDDSGLTTSTDSLSNHSTGSQGSSATNFVFVISGASPSPTPFREGNSLNVDKIISYSQLAVSLKRLTEEHEKLQAQHATLRLDHEKLQAQHAELRLHLGNIMEMSTNSIRSLTESKILSESRSSNCASDFESDLSTTTDQKGQGDARKVCKEEGLRLSDNDNLLERVKRIEILTDIFEAKFKLGLCSDTKHKNYDFKSIAEVLATIWYLTERYYKGIDTEFDRNEMCTHLTNCKITQFLRFPSFYELYHTCIIPKLTAYVKVTANKEDYIRKLLNITDGLINLYVGIYFSLGNALCIIKYIVLDNFPVLRSRRNLIFQENVLNLIHEDSSYKGFGSDHCDILKNYVESCYSPMEKYDTILSWEKLNSEWKISPITNLFNIESLQKLNT